MIIRNLVFALVLCFVMVPAGQAAKGLPELSGLVQKLQPTVVNISTTQNVQPKKNPLAGQNPFEGTPFEDFFRQFQDRMPDGNKHSARSLGSGFIIDQEGYILTNHHVVEEADKIMVRLSDEREFDAEVIGSDSKTDLALIRIHPQGQLAVAELGDSDRAEVGSWVIAIGNPFGLETTVTVGIISAKGRVIGAGPYDNFLQTDAAINPGNSGGPLFNLDGEVVGMTTAIYSRSGGNMGIGFAIPINMAKQIVNQLKTQGHVTRGWLGVSIQTVTKELVDAMGLSDEGGALVASVDPEGPAAAAGIKTGDVIVRFDNKPIKKMHDLPALVAATNVGKAVDVEVFRKGHKENLSVKIAQLNDDTVATNTKPTESPRLGLLGMNVRNLTPELREKTKIAAETIGVLVTEIEEGSPASLAGVHQGDVIQEVNYQPVRTVEEFREAMNKIAVGKSIPILVLRQGSPLYLALRRSS